MLEILGSPLFVSFPNIKYLVLVQNCRYLPTLCQTVSLLYCYKIIKYLHQHTQHKIILL